MNLNEMKDQIGKDETHRLPKTQNGPGKIFNELIEKCLIRQPDQRPDFTKLVSMITALKKRLDKKA
jgi:hypothetical protein